MDKGPIHSAQSGRARRRLKNVKGSMSLSTAFGSIPNRLQLAGGWIDQPFMSRGNPRPPGAMVVVQIEPSFRPMDRSGLATGTRGFPAFRRTRSTNSLQVTHVVSSAFRCSIHARRSGPAAGAPHCVAGRRRERGDRPDAGERPRKISAAFVHYNEQIRCQSD